MPKYLSMPDPTGTTRIQLIREALEQDYIPETCYESDPEFQGLIQVGFDPITLTEEWGDAQAAEWINNE